MTIIYIAGYSRSGSTILDMLLGAHPDICSTGELNTLIEDWQDPARLCTCGKPYAECPFWSGLSKEHPLTAAVADNLVAVETRSRLGALERNEIPADELLPYTKFTQTLFHYIHLQSGKAVVVDSSKSARKSAGRALALYRHSGEDVYVIHLARSLSETINSFIRNGSNWALEGKARPSSMPGLRSIFGWFLANRCALRVKASIPANNYVFVRYSDLIDDTTGTLSRIGAKIRVDMTPILERVAAGVELNAPHNVGGNRLRFQSQRLRRSNKPAEIPFYYRTIARYLERWLRTKTG